MRLPSAQGEVTQFYCLTHYLLLLSEYLPVVPQLSYFSIQALSVCFQTIILH